MARDGFPWYRREKRCWYVWLSGKQVRLHEDKEKALRLWHRLALGENEGTQSGPTVASVVDDYLAGSEAKVKPATLLNRKKALLPLKEDHGGLPAASLTPDLVLGWLGTKPWGRSTRWLNVGVLKSCFKKVAPALADLSVPGPLSRGAEALVSAGEYATLLAKAPQAYRDVLTVLWLTGCRPAELCAAEAANLDPKASALVLGEHKTDRTGRPRVVLLPPAAAEICGRLAALHPEGELFRNTHGEALTSVQIRKWIYKVRKRVGLERVTAYGFRHAFASDLLAQGVPDAQVAELLGHRGTAMLHKHYAHLSARTQALREALEKASEGR
jgi:integrase